MIAPWCGEHPAIQNYRNLSTPMVYFRKYFGKCALTAHFAPQTTPQSPTNDLPTTRSPILLRPPSPALYLRAFSKGKK